MLPLPLPPPDALQYLEHGRLLLVLGLLAANACEDVRRRTLLWGDRHYAAIGTGGLCMFLLVEQGWRDPSATLSMVAGITMALALWRCRGMASGDCVLLLVVSVLLPTYGGIYFVPVFVALLGITLTAFLVVAYNFALNVSQAAMPRGRPPLFSKYPNAGKWKRAFAVFAAHEKRAWETHVVPVLEDGRGSFSIFRTQQFGQRDWDVVPAGRLVLVAGPMVVFFLTVLALIAVVAWVGGGA